MAAAVLLALVVLRPLWLFPATAMARSLQHRREVGVPLGWRQTAVASWAGMRGVVTVATALALPHSRDGGGNLAWRQSVVLVALICVLATLVVQGLTLTPLVQRRGVGSDVDEEADVSRLRMAALRAAVEALRAEAGSGAGTPDPVCEAAIVQYEGRLQAHEMLEQKLQGRNRDGTALAADPSVDLGDIAERLRAAMQRGSDVEREVVLRARATGDISSAAADEVLDEIEVRAARTA